MTVRVESIEDLQTMIRNGERDKLSIFQHPLLPLDPSLSEDDDRWIRFLMDDNSGRHVRTSNEFNANQERRNYNEERASQPPPPHELFRLVIQCRNLRSGQPTSPETANHNFTSYQEFDKAVTVLGARRDVLFSILEPSTETVDNADNISSSSSFCSNASTDDGRVKIWDVHLHDKDTLLHNGGYLESFTEIIDGLGFRLRPDLMWFDRRMTAPIAFHQRYHRHAVLFVDLHDPASAPNTRDAVRAFRQECRQLRETQPPDHPELAIVCLVVPVSCVPFEELSYGPISYCDKNSFPCSFCFIHYNAANTTTAIVTVHTNVFVLHARASGIFPNIGAFFQWVV